MTFKPPELNGNHVAADRSLPLRARWRSVTPLVH
jgi:hypothetical protein